VLLLVVCGALLVAWASAALPPGYEDELFCPPGACLRKKEVVCATCVCLCVSRARSTAKSNPSPPRPRLCQTDQM
jgi:hypothetical protein